jgi:para-nitrobenzyl esterase
VDGHILPDDPNALFAAGREHPVPLIIGNTREEMAIMLLGTLLPTDEAGYHKKLADEFGEQAGPLAKAYPAHDAVQIRSALVQLSSDLSFVRAVRWMARKHAAAGQKVFRYQFSRGTQRGILQSLGAHHGADLAFTFQRPLGSDEGRRRISRNMGRYWIHFAATGDPNGPGLPAWPVYRTDTEEMIDFAAGITVLKGYHNDQLDAAEKALGATAGSAPRKPEK